MDIQVTGLLAFATGILFLQRGPTFAFYIFIPCTLLASCAAVLLPALGSAMIQPSHLLLGFLLITVLSTSRDATPAFRCMTFPREGFWLIATGVYAIVSAFLMPRLFAGAAQVNAIGAGEFGPSLTKVPLGPTSGNITQSVYFIGDVVCFFVCYEFVQSRKALTTVVNAMLIYCVLNVVFAVLDLATFWTGTVYLLDFIRNSTYVMHNETVVNGLKRIVGSFTEASAFAYATIGGFGFTLRLWLGGVRPVLNFVLSVLSGLLLIFSTSTTAYVGMPLLLACLFAASAARAWNGKVPASVFKFLIFSPLVVVLLVAAIMLQPDLASNVRAFLDILVFDKSSSDSAADRGSWNKAAVDAFLATYGLGAGTGSVRASSFLLAVLANLGLVGVITYGMFMFLTLFRQSPGKLDWYVFEVRAAARTACLAIVIAASISGALIDLGLPFFILAALACAANDLWTREGARYRRGVPARTPIPALQAVSPRTTFF